MNCRTMWTMLSNCWARRGLKTRDDEGKVPSSVCPYPHNFLTSVISPRLQGYATRNPITAVTHFMLSVYLWRNFSFLITSNSTTGTPPRDHTGSPLTHWGWSRETSIPSHPHLYNSPNLVSSARHQLGGSIRTTSVILCKHNSSKRYLDD